MSNFKISKGTLLISQPSILTDVSFSRAVILIAEHNMTGTVGFIINKPLPYTIDALVPEIDASFSVFNGGPVEQDNLYFVHTVPEVIPNSVEISDGIFWGGNFEVLTHAVNSGKIDKKQIRFFLGYSGWQPSQLEKEIEEQAWMMVKNEYKNRIFEKPANDFWKKELLDLGGTYAIWSNAPEDPSLN